jgi:co-chaperonin GroES (HSP10)
MAEVGDRVLVESEKVGQVTRSGVVTAVDGVLITVRWDSGSESVFM